MGITAGVGALIGGGLGAAGAIGSSVIQGNAQEDAAKQQMAIYQQTRSDLAPYRSTGTQAFSQLANLLGLNGGGSAGMLSTLQNTPGYQFAVQQGQQGLDRSAASRGLLLSGGQLKDTVNYNQGMATQLYNNTVSQLTGAATIGENAAAQTGSAGTAAAAASGGFTAGAGTSYASGLAGAANNLGAGLYQYSQLNPTQTGSSDLSVNVTPELYDPNTGLSDRRAKTEIRRVGTLDSGLPVYSYRLKGSNLPQMGVMADEVRRVDPGAVRRDPETGYDRVNYRRVSELPPMRKAA